MKLNLHPKNGNNIITRYIVTGPVFTVNIPMSVHNFLKNVKKY